MFTAAGCEPLDGAVGPQAVSSTGEQRAPRPNPGSETADDSGGSAQLTSATVVDEPDEESEPAEGVTDAGEVPAPASQAAETGRADSAVAAVIPDASVVPVRVSIPALGIEAVLDPLALDETGVLTPPEYGRAGWYEAGPEPGERGRAVIAGHLDSAEGPDVFWDLADAAAGDEIVIDLSDGSSVSFVIGRVGQYAQSEFPTDEVYGGPGAVAELRLITCGGEYDHTAGRYLDNVVVFATAA